MFGLTWPVLELLANNAEFFIARRSSKAEIFLLSIGLLIVIPAAIGALGAIPGRLGSVLAIILTVLTATSVAYLGLRQTALEWWVAVLLSFLLAAGLTWALWRLEVSRQVVRYLVLTPLVVMAVFLFATPAGAVLRDRGSTVGWPVGVDKPAPVVMVVFDEFPVASIIDPEGELRRDRYPNLARLADDGIWFPNAMTVEQQTEHSIPAILSGALPDQSLTPFAGQYPNTLFTALQGTYEFHVYEAITQLCPVNLCEQTAPSATPIMRDVGVVAGHLLLPEPMTEDLPPIDSSWGDFAGTTTDFEAREVFREVMGDRLAPVEKFTTDLEEADPNQPGLFFLHTLLPHHPWEYLPDGTSYPLLGMSTPGTHSGGWIDDDFLTAQGMQRHLLQVGYVDHLLGDMIAAMESSGIYDDALVVVVADHGISVKPGVPHQRKITPTTVGEIAAIPLFVKPPNWDGGEPDQRRALTTDILPTIADVLGATIPWNLDGSSLLRPPPARTETTTIGPERAVTYGVDGEEKLETAARIERWFPGGDPWALIPDGAPEILGETVDASSLPLVDGLSYELVKSNLYEKVITARGRVPSRVAVKLRGEVDGSELFAISVNGMVAAITRSYVDDDTTGFMATVPPQAFVDGYNDVEVIHISPDGSLLRVEPHG